MSETFFNPDLKIKPGGDEYGTMRGISVGVPGTPTYREQPMVLPGGDIIYSDMGPGSGGAPPAGPVNMGPESGGGMIRYLPPETKPDGIDSIGGEKFFNPDLNVEPGGDTFRTMGGLDALPAESSPTFDLGQFIGSAAQLAQLYPGSQNRPQYTPGLTDLRFTRSFQGVSPTGSAYTPSGAGAAPGPDPNKIVYQQPFPEYGSGNLDAALMGGLLGMDWSGAYQDYLDRLEAEAQDINISNVFTPTNTNVNQLSQSQYQIQGDGSSSDSQDQSDRFDFDDSLTDEALGGGLDDFFKYGPAALNAAEGAAAYAKASAEAERKRVADEQARVAAEQARLQAEAEQTRKLAEQQRIAEEQRLAAEEAKRQEEQRRIAEEQARQAEAAREAERQRQLAAEEAERQAAAKTEADRQAAAEAEADRQAAAAEAERQRQAAIQTKTAPVVNEATTKFQSDITNAIKQRDNIKNALDEATRVVGMHKVDKFKRQSAPPIPQTVIDDLQANYTSLDNALKNYNVDEILKNPDYAREQALQSGSNALQALTDPSKPPSPDAVNRVFTAVFNKFGAPIIAENISKEGAQALLSAAGPEFVPGAAQAAAEAYAKALAQDATEEAAQAAAEAAAEEAAASFAGDLTGPVSAALISLARGDSVGTAAAEAAKAYIVATLAATPGVGQAIAAVIYLDSFLSKALGYESPIDDVVAGAAKSVDKAISWTGDRAIGGDPIGAIGRAISNPIRSISRAFGFQEGGLVDLPGDSMYNDNSQGVLPDIEGYARGGIIPLPGGGKIAKGPGGGLDDLIPTSIDGRRAAALSDGEFVIPADVVSMMGDGSTNAGSKRLYDLVRQVRQHKTGTSRQAGPLQVGKILERTMR
jgi:hypothetical protein